MLQADPNTANMVDDPLTYMGNIMLLIVGGNDTTRNSMSGGVVFLNQFPDQMAKVRANPELIPSMVSEIIRFQTPLPHMRRTATQDVSFGGQQIAKGDKVLLWYVSGNYDESVIERPNDFWIERPERTRAFILWCGYSSGAWGIALPRCSSVFYGRRR
jgi:cytochrome P450